MILDKLNDIAKEHNIILTKIVSGDKYCIVNGEDKYTNRSWISGGQFEIFLGFYENEELMIASFFHEIGHVYNSKNGKFNSEEDAWKIGFELANKHGFKFNEKTYL